jgi:hypothetical protein
MIAVFRERPFLAPTILGCLVLMSLLWQSVESVSAKTIRGSTPLDRSVQLFTKLYYKKDGQYAARVIDMEQRHKFESGKIGKALHLRYPDGTQGWVSAPLAERQFLTKLE